MPSDKDILAEMLTVLIEKDLELLKSGEATPADKERIRKILADHNIQADHKGSALPRLAGALAENLPFKEGKKTA